MINARYKSKSLTMSLKKLLILFITLIMIMITVIIKLNSSDPVLTFNILTVFGVLVFGWIIASWYLIEKNAISVYIFFMLFSVLFYLGQPLAFLLGAQESALKVYSIRIYSYPVLNETLVFVLISYMLIHIGGILAKNTNQKLVSENVDYKNYNYSMDLTGKILFLISIIPTLILIINSIRAVMTLGYIGLFISINTIAVNGGIIGILAGFFVPSIYLLLIANSKNKIKIRLYSFIFFVYILAIFMLGSRGENSIYLLGFILIWHNMIKPIKGKNLIKLVLFGLIGVFVLAIISQVRAYINSGDIGNILNNSMQNTNLLGIVRDIFSEFGITLLVPATIIDKVPNVIPFYNGKTLVNFFLTLIPNTFWEINPGLKDGTLEGLVTPFISRGKVGGVGGSFLAEIYYNFGYFGYIILPIYGIILTKLTESLNFITSNENKLNFFFALYFYTKFLWLIRSEVLTSGKDIIYFALFPIILIKLLNLIKSNKRIKKWNYSM